MLKKILAHKRLEIKSAKKKISLAELKQVAELLPKKKSTFLLALRNRGPMAVIAEVKRRSPSKGLLVKKFDALQIAKDYCAGGAAALSVLTDKKFFGGSEKILTSLKRHVNLPVLRKDFIIDEYQIYESRLMGADAILLIATVLSKSLIEKFYQTAYRIGLDVLVEVHSDADIQKLRDLRPECLGINNRDLKTFKVDLSTTEKLIKRISWRPLIVSESGIAHRADIERLKNMGVRVVLVGEGLVKQRAPKKALKNLLKKNDQSQNLRNNKF